MALTDDDVREILRIIDESQLAELRVETHGFRLHVRKENREQRTENRRQTTDDGRQTADAAIEAPVVGVFYVADAPGEPPFVDIGSRVDPDTVVGIIEVMKMMNTVPAGVTGTIAEICVENAELVEEGQVLFRVAS